MSFPGDWRRETATLGRGRLAATTTGGVSHLCCVTAEPAGSPKADVCAFPLEKVLCHERALPGAWVVGQSAGGCRNNSCFPCNPKFWLRLSEPSEVYMAVLQRPRRRAVGQARALVGHSPAPVNLLGKDYQAVGLHIWKVTLPAWPHGGWECRPVEAWVPEAPTLAHR